MNISKVFAFLTFILCFTRLTAQDDLLNMLDQQTEQKPEIITATFKSTHIINGHSVEQMKPGQLDFRINHRFGQVNLGWYEFWGLDNALVSFDFGYGINKWLMAGLRRSTYNKTFDGSLKFSLLHQTEGSKVFPVTVSYYTNMSINSMKDDMLNDHFTRRLGYTHQLLVARKFNDHISLQLSPTFVHRNLVNFDEDNNIYAAGLGGRYKFHRRVALTFEYFWTSASLNNDIYHNPLSLGVDLETGGHVFQFFLSNARIMEESGFISETDGSWLKGGIYFGFNISRVFALTHPKE